jgi:hypothetical protein
MARKAPAVAAGASAKEEPMEKRTRGPNGFIHPMPKVNVGAGVGEEIGRAWSDPKAWSPRGEADR